jgi:hypothetical protein
MVAETPSSATETSSTENDEVSSSVMVKTPVASLIVALDGLDKVKVTVSLSSSVVSAKTGTLNVPDVAPALIVKVPLVAV